MGVAIEVRELRAWFGANEALHGISVQMRPNTVTAIIGPSGCGKSTFVRCINRMHETVPGARVEGTVLIGNTDVYGNGTPAVEVRRRVGMVFQKPNPFPSMTIYDNVAAGLKLNQPTAALSLQVYTYAISPYDQWHKQAWAGALVMITIIMGTIAIVRVVASRGLLKGTS